MLEPGSMVGEYRVERLLGGGTFGDVYAAEHPLIGKRVAIKLLREKLSENPEVVARFMAEARAVNRVRNSHIVDIVSFGTLDERGHYFVMELLEGLTLGALLDREGRLSPARALPILEGIADALDAAHEAGVVHRDLKPDNVFLVTCKDGSYFPKLVDFGVAKLVTDEMGIKTATGVAIGTPRYMSPEQCRGKAVDHRTDVYALGVLIHFMLTGQPPFAGEAAVDLLLKHTCDPPPSMSSVCPDLPPELDAPVLAMLAKRPADRPSSAGRAVALLAERAGASTGSTTLPLGRIVMTPADQLATLVLPPVPAAPAPAPRAPVLAATVAAEPLHVGGEEWRTAPAPPPAAPAPLPAAPAPAPAPAPNRAVYLVAGALVFALGGGVVALLGHTSKPAPSTVDAPAPTVSPALTLRTAAPDDPMPAPSAVPAAVSADPLASAASKPAASPKGRPTPRDPPPAAAPLPAHPKTHDIGF